jgi:hypothetical protein
MSGERGSMVLRDRRDAGGTRWLGAAWRDGAIVIEGQDLGPGVEAAFGEGLTEYEWTWTIPPEGIASLVEALGGTHDDDPLVLLKRWFDAHGVDPGSHLREAGVPVDFWSRVGD